MIRNRNGVARAFARSIFTLALVIVMSGIAWAQVYTVDISKSERAILNGHLKLGTNTNSGGHSLNANSLYFIKDGKPWYPVMGEFHFSRYPRAKWEESILKMKACGIDVIATYIFWIYHEEDEGKFNWNGNNDFKAFLELCKKHNIFVFARIGPWCHGEVRNGGFPDWIVKRGNMRKNNPEYLIAVQKFYDEIGIQLKGLYFKDDGPIIGAQIENEFRFNSATGLEHILTLKRMAVKAGIDVPYYTATGWPGSNLKQTELVPVWGAYPEAPWDKKTGKLPLSGNYSFSLLRNDPAIGSDLLGQHKEDTTGYKGFLYPYATAEMGGGIQVTYHRRPLIDANDVSALAYVKIGAGANLMGYYMFHGGSNAIGAHSTLQESKASNYPNDYPIISYDFQAPIGQSGRLRPSYRKLKVIHSFLNDFGDRLAQYTSSFPDQLSKEPSDSTTLRFAVRSKGKSGFVFVSNYQRQLLMKQQDVQFDLKLHETEHFVFPEKTITIPSGTQVILPVNMDIEGVNLRYATVQPLHILTGERPTYVFFAPKGIVPEYVFDETNLSRLENEQGTPTKRNGSYLISGLKPGTGCLTKLFLKNGKQVNILTLTDEQSLDAWKGKINEVEHLFISKHNLMFTASGVEIESVGNPLLKLSVYPSLKKVYDKKFAQASDGDFTTLTTKLKPQNLIPKISVVTDISKYQNKGALLPENDRNDKNTPASPGPQYQTNLKHVEGAKYWEISMLTGSLALLLDVDYAGDTGALYEDGKLINDDFYYGQSMQTNISSTMGKNAERRFLLQVVPLTNERKLYQEPDIAKNNRMEDASIRSIKLIVNYHASLTW
jgi:beta-galactosidase